MTTKAIHSARVLNRHHEPVLLATAQDELVTCRRCLYWLRRYIPLSKLPRHQAWQRDHFRRVRYGHN